MGRFEERAEQQIRQAQRRGDLDVAPGPPRPLRLGDPDDPNWWVKQLIERERLDMTAALPPAVALRKEADAFPDSLLGMSDEDAVRAVLEDFNARVDADWRRPAVGPTSPVVARQVDVDDVLARWRELREDAAPAPEPAAPAAATRRRWNPFSRRGT